jgi:aldehyde:ferredoxin oxidoreductase
MRDGYNGKILHVNLTTHEFKVETPSEEFYRKYLGGSALNCYYLLKMVPVGADPLGPENVFAVSVSVTTGAPFAGNSRVVMSAKSPLTGLIGDSQAGGFFPAEMKFAGFDAFIFTGQSAKPVYLWIDDGKYELRDASHLWGKITGDAEDLIREELGDSKIQVAQIGPAGENGVKYACILNMCNRANGRTGMGAVMGSKKLRAIAVRGKLGKKNFKMAFPDEFKKLAKQGADGIKGSPMEGFGKYGTNANVIPLHMSGGLPTRNFITGSFNGYDKISGETIYEKHLRGAAEGKQDFLGRDTCYACPVRCKRVMEYDDGKIKVDERYGGPEYETVAMMGCNVGIDDIYVIAKANELCNKFGLDTISTGGTIAWAMECFEKGIITTQDTGGIELKFGNTDALLKMIELIAKREGFGDVLADGSWRAAQKIGKGSEELLVASNKQEFPAHMPRFKRNLGLIYAVNPFGADHVSTGHDGQYERDEFNSDGTKAEIPATMAQFAQIGLDSPALRYSLGKEKVKFTRLTQDLHAMLDTLCVCLLASSSFGDVFLPEDITKLVEYVTGWDVTLKELMQAGERRVNMMRAFNAREGYTKEKDQLPLRMFQPMQGGASDGFKIERQEFEDAKQEYYNRRGWDPETGNPTPEKLTELGLEWIYELA